VIVSNCYLLPSRETGDHAGKICSKTILLHQIHVRRERERETVREEYERERETVIEECKKERERVIVECRREQ
jgi:hypothetical protein